MWPLWKQSSGDGMTDKPRWSDDKLEQFYLEFKEHVTDEKALMLNFMKAFPGDDPVEHRKYHEQVMRAAEAQEQFWQELRLDIAKKGVWGLLILLIGLAVAGVTVKLGIKP